MDWKVATPYIIFAIAQTIALIVTGVKKFNVINTEMAKLKSKNEAMEDRVDKMEHDNSEVLRQIAATLEIQGRQNTELLVKMARIEGHLEGYKEGKGQRS